MEAMIGRGKGQQESKGKARRGETCGSRESATLFGSSAGVCSCGLRFQQKISRTTNNQCRRFVGCPRYRDNRGCRYFRWIDHPFEASISEIVVEEEVSSSKWEMKYLKLNMKELEEELKHRQNSSHPHGWSGAIRATSTLNDQLEAAFDLLATPLTEVTDRTKCDTFSNF
ncbi:hypothetical protein CRG98_023832 [Punica granatum]|uniref:GRF-type domain-containing protein n=1 Tax=Punica granatum TaxID=22663 RepID=A0A2I0JHN6_PUNGR|nr:hypothetical protein CRG98_023832 [Punica granatum]